MSVQMNTGIHLFLQEPLLRTLLISGEVGAGKTYALLQTLHHRGRSYSMITSHTDVSAMHEVIDIQRTLERAQIVRQAYPWDTHDLLICEGLDHFDRSTWLRILHEQNRRYKAGRPLQIIATYTGTEGLSQWVYDMDMWIPIETPDLESRVRVLADSGHAEPYEIDMACESHHREGTLHRGISIDASRPHRGEQICHERKVMIASENHREDQIILEEKVKDVPRSPTVHDSIYTYISSLVERFRISFMGMEYILLKAAIGLAKEKYHQFVEPTDVEAVLPWTLPQKMKHLVNSRTQQDGASQDSFDQLASDEINTEQEETEDASSNKRKEGNTSQGIDRKSSSAEQVGRTHEGMAVDSDESHNGQSKEENTLELDQAGEKLDTGNDGTEKEKDINGGEQREPNGPEVEVSFTLSKTVEAQVLHVYGMLQSRDEKKPIDIRADGRGTKTYRQGTTGRTIAWIPTIVQGVVRSRQLPIQLTKEDVRYAMHQEIPKEAIYLVVDASGSMSQRSRLEGTKKLLSQLIQMLYVKRQYVSLITFQKQGAKCVVPLTKQVEKIPSALEASRIGGRTPFVKGMEEAIKQIGIDMSQMEHMQAKVVIITDGKVTSQALQGLEEIGKWLMKQGIQATVIDTDTSFVRINRAKEIAHILRGELIEVSGGGFYN